MNPISSPGSASRRAALLLHAMFPADRTWLLASLAPERRRRMEDLLRELQELGIPADALLLQGLTEGDSPTAAVGPLQRLQSLSDAEIAWLAARLEEEPAALTAMLLAQRAWPWRAALLDRLDPMRQQSVVLGAASRALPLPGAALCEALAEMLPIAAPPPPTSTVGRLWGRLRLPTLGAGTR